MKRVHRTGGPPQEGEEGDGDPPGHRSRAQQVEGDMGSLEVPQVRGLLHQGGG